VDGTPTETPDVTKQARAFIVRVTYEIWDKHREEYLEAIGLVREHAIEVGALSYRLLEDDDQPNRFTEELAFDDWSHYKRVQAKALAPEMEEIYASIARWTIGGEAETEVRYLSVIEEA